MRRTVVLALFAALGMALAALTVPAPRRTPRELARGPRPFLLASDAIRRLEVDVGTRRVAADRAGAAWRVEAGPAPPALADALDALANELVGLRAIDAFRPADTAGLGLSPPAGTLAVTTARGVQRLELGGVNAAGSAFYARRAGHARVLLLGIYVRELVRRVIEARDAAAAEAGAPRRYWPEMG